MNISALPREHVLALLRYRLPNLVDDATLELADYRHFSVDAVRAAHRRCEQAKDLNALPAEMHLLLPLLSETRLPHVIERIQVMLALAPPLAGRSYLDIGAGIGRDCLAFARCGAQVTHADLDCETRDFAAWRYAQRGLNVRIADVRQKPQEWFDVIGCHDVFEHVDDPTGLMADFVAHLAPGGTLFISFDLFNPTHDNEHKPKNDFYATFYDSLLQHLGLELALGHSNPVQDVVLGSLRIYTRKRPIADSFASEYAQIRDQAYTFAERQLFRLRCLLEREHEQVRENVPDSALASSPPAMAVVGRLSPTPPVISIPQPLSR